MRDTYARTPHDGSRRVRSDCHCARIRRNVTATGTPHIAALEVRVGHAARTRARRRQRRNAHSSPRRQSRRQPASAAHRHRRTVTPSTTRAVFARARVLFIRVLYRCCGCRAARTRRGASPRRSLRLLRASCARTGSLKRVWGGPTLQPRARHRSPSCMLPSRAASRTRHLVGTAAARATVPAALGR